MRIRNEVQIDDTLLETRDFVFWKSREFENFGVRVRPGSQRPYGSQPLARGPGKAPGRSSETLRLRGLVPQQLSWSVIGQDSTLRSGSEVSNA